MKRLMLLFVIGHSCASVERVANVLCSLELRRALVYAQEAYNRGPMGIHKRGKAQ